MFNKALQSFVADTLEPLGLESANVFTFHAWAFNEVKRAYNGKIEICTDPFEGVETARAIKKQIGILSALDEFVCNQTRRLNDWVQEKLQPYDAQEWGNRLAQSDRPIVQHLIELREQALSARNRAEGKEWDRLEQIHVLMSKAVTRMTLYKEELQNFFMDEALLKTHLPQVPLEDLEILARYQQALQGKGGSSRRPGPYIAFDDLALILRLIQLKHGGMPDKDRDGQVNLFEHLIIDEAQDFGALDMTVLLSAVRARSGVTIVGDANQKIIPEIDFIGWDKLVEQLGVEGATVSKLEVAHRSTKPIMDLACSVVGEPPSEGRPGEKPVLRVFDDNQVKTDFIASTINSLMEERPNSHLCVVCRHARDAEPLMETLKRENITVPVRRGHNRNFEFSPGVTVANLKQIKGLEFDSVILLDPSEENFPDNLQGQKFLYTVITRAKDRLYMIGDGAPSLLLDQAIGNDLLNVDKKQIVDPIKFTAADEGPI